MRSTKMTPAPEWTENVEKPVSFQVCRQADTVRSLYEWEVFCSALSQH